MAYLIELDDLRKRIIYPPDYPYPWDGNGDAPEIKEETSVPATNLDEAPPTSVQSEFDL